MTFSASLESLKCKISEGDIVTVSGFVDKEGKLIEYKAEYRSDGLHLIPLKPKNSLESGINAARG